MYGWSLLLNTSVLLAGSSADFSQLFLPLCCSQETMMLLSTCQSLSAELEAFCVLGSVKYATRQTADLCWWCFTYSHLGCHSMTSSLITLEIFLLWLLINIIRENDNVLVPRGLKEASIQVLPVKRWWSEMSWKNIWRFTVLEPMKSVSLGRFRSSFWND